MIIGCGRRVETIVPFAVPGVAGEAGLLQLPHLPVGDLHALGVSALVEPGLDFQAGAGGGCPALLNASREVAGLLGITVIGAVLRSRQGAALHDGAGAVPAFIDGFHAGLYVTVGLAVAGVLVSYLALRRFASVPGGTEPEQAVITPDEVAAPL